MTAAQEEFNRIAIAAMQCSPCKEYAYSVFNDTAIHLGLDFAETFELLDKWALEAGKIEARNIIEKSLHKGEDMIRLSGDSPRYMSIEIGSIGYMLFRGKIHQVQIVSIEKEGINVKLRDEFGGSVLGITIREDEAYVSALEMMRDNLVLL